jgi:hypothetical protein
MLSTSAQNRSIEPEARAQCRPALCAEPDHHVSFYRRYVPNAITPVWCCIIKAGQLCTPSRLHKLLCTLDEGGRVRSESWATKRLLGCTLVYILFDVGILHE